MELSSVFREGGVRLEAAAQVLMLLSREPSSQPAMQEQIGISLKELSIVLKKLSEKGYIEAEPERRGLLKFWRLCVGGD
jgi:DNA-binding IclR family transcriptional regulator